MQSIFMAISDLIASLLYQHFYTKPYETKTAPIIEEEKVPVGYRPLFFHCWLCDGTTKFACKSFAKKKKLTIECSRCGMENVVTVNVKS